MKAEERVCLALDFPSRPEILSCARRFAGRVGWMKVGLEAFTAEGPSIVREIAAQGPRVFLDLKFHDIPATVERAVAAAARTGAAMITLLTSLDARSLSDLPIAGDPRGIARRLALLARDCKLDGVVCSAEDLPAVRGACGPGFLTVVPGIRPAGSPATDQKRVATPAQALAAGADILVVGRPVTGAPDPDLTLENLILEIESARASTED